MAEALSADSPLERLARCDAQLERARVLRHSLAPERDAATTLRSLGERLLPDAGALAPELADGMVRVAHAVAEHFPDNLFWDLDGVFGELLREAQATGDARGHLAASMHEIVALHGLFGQQTTIRFRYVHDFVYGFDWAKWVSRDPEARADVGPFALSFLRSVHARGHELLALIDEDDAKYPQLPGAEARNPFPFSRDPDAESALYRDLAARGLIPVPTWRLLPDAVWDRPFARAREERARALRL